VAKFTVNSKRNDPYRNFKFRIKWDGKYVAAVSKCTALKRTTEMLEYRDGGDPSGPHKAPGKTKFEPITMERGVTHDTAFEAWANKVWDYGNAQAPADQRQKEVSLQDFRKDFLIDLFNEAGQKVISYKVYRAWVSEYTAQADLDANANAILIQSIKVEHEGWERDQDTKEPVEPSYNDPAA
jgi:phage tail-like protein